MARFRVYSDVGHNTSSESTIEADYFEIKGSVLFFQTTYSGPVAAFNNWLQVELLREENEV